MQIERQTIRQTDRQTDREKNERDNQSPAHTEFGVGVVHLFLRPGFTPQNVTGCGL